MKTTAIVRIVAFSLAILILGGILFVGIVEEAYMVEGNYRIEPVENLEKMDIEYVTAEVRNIEIDWVCGSISIHADEVITDIEVTEFASVDAEHTMVCKQSGQTLKIDYSEDDFEVFGFNSNEFESKNLVIRVPDEWIGKNIEIETASAEVNLSGLTFNTFDFDGASGDCRMMDCDIDEIDVDTASGNITFSGTLDVLDCDAASADCNIVTFNVPRSIKMDAASGDLELVLPPNAGFSCKIDSLSGDLKTDFETTTENDIYYHGDGACEIEMTAMSGDVSILKGIE